MPATCRELEQDLKDNPPELLVLCPPCTDEGGLFHLNKQKMASRRVSETHHPEQELHQVLLPVV